jgi:hypothetical protein
MTKPHSGYIGSTSSGFEWTVDPHWDDLQATESQGTGGASLTYGAFRDSPFKIYALTGGGGADDEFHFRFQLPHAADPTAEVRFHLHTVALTDPAAAQVAVIDGQYAWCLANQEIPATAGWTTFQKLLPVAVGDVNKHKIHAVFSSTPPAGSHESAILLVYLKRTNGAGADTYTGDLGILSVDTHVQKIRLGSIAELPTGV